MIRRINIIGNIILLMIIFQLKVYSQHQDQPSYGNYYRILCSYALEARNKNDFNKALEYALRALDIIEKHNNIESEDYWIITDAIGQLYNSLWRFSEALDYFKRSRNTILKLEGKSHSYYVTILNNIGVTYMELGKYAKALDCFNESKEIYRIKNDTKSKEYAALLNNFGSVYYRMKDYNSAANSFKEALNIIKNFPNTSIEIIGPILNNIAASYQHGEKYDEALKYFAESIPILKSAKALGEHYVNALFNAATIYNVHIKDADKALELLNEALSYCNQLGNENTPLYVYKGSILIYIGSIYDNKNEIETALIYYNEAYSIMQKSLSLNDSFVSLLSTMGSNYSQLKDYKNSIIFYKKALEAQNNIAGRINKRYIEIAQSLGSIYKNTADYENVLIIYKEVLALQQKMFGNKSMDVADTMDEIGFLYMKQEKITDALSYFFDVLNIIKVNLGDNNIAYATVLSNIGVAYDKKGDYKKSFDFLSQSLKLKSQLIGENNISYAYTLGNLSYSSTLLGDYKTALKYLMQALQIYENSDEKDINLLVGILSNIGYIYRVTGDYENAMIYATKANKMITAHPGADNYAIGQSLNYLGIIHNSLNNPDKALEYFEKTLNLYDKSIGKNHPDYGFVLSNIANSYCIKKDYTKAEENLEKTINIFNQFYSTNHPLYIQMQFNMLNLYGEAEQYEKIAKNYDILKKNIMSNVLNGFSYLSDVKRSKYWESQMHYICSSYDFINRSNNHNTKYTYFAYDAALFSKGLILNSTIELRKLILESRDEELLNIFDKARNVEKRLQGTDITPEVRDSLASQSEMFSRELMSRSKEFGDFTRNLSLDWKDVQHALKRNDVAIEFVDYIPYKSDTTKYAALVLRKGWKNPRMIDISTGATLEKHLKNQSRIYSGFQSKLLYKEIWGKLEEYINKGDNIYFSPSGLLHQMNIEVFTDEDGKMAGDKYNLYRLSSTRQLCVDIIKQEPHSATLYGGLRYDIDTTQMIAISRNYGERSQEYFSRSMLTDSVERVGWSYLPNTKLEVESIGGQLRDKNITPLSYTEDIGTEESFKALSGKRTPIIHIATHGFFMKNEEAKKRSYFEPIMLGDNTPTKKENSMKRSGLIMSGGQRAWLGEKLPDGIDDGVLLAEEISVLDLRGTDLVVLSACDTGLGEITSEGVFGLQRAFKMAGAQTLVMSLWRVSDEATAYMMEQFYSNYLAGNSKRKSFIRAQEAVRKRYEEPYYWASFILLD